QDNLWGQEVDIYHEVAAHWGTIQRYLSALMAWRGVDGIVAEEFTVPPGIGEMASLLQLVRLHDAGEYDAIIVDCAPTAETLELLTFPEVTRWWMEKLFPIHRKVASMARPLIRPLVSMPLPGDDVYAAAEGLFLDLDRTQKLLTDSSISSVRLVVNAEKMVVKEAMRTSTYLNLYNYPTDLVVCNRVIPPEVTDSYFDRWKESQARYIQMVEESFAPVPIRYVPYMDREIVGLEALGAVAEKLFGQDDPIQLFHRDRSFSFEKTAEGYDLVMPLPFAAKSDVELRQMGDELIIQIANQRRNLMLPRSISGMRTRGAKLEDGTLRVRFSPPEGAKQAK
ncbi:MAG TPA: TRC40/GET3/ArsA family transport-energizing ATPase, partial [Chloroflexota bacterium]|nr:TRC40/GET3/ArsA family transport-energizing ATPase [Chloroflexota bacterium]